MPPPAPTSTALGRSTSALHLWIEIFYYVYGHPSQCPLQYVYLYIHVRLSDIHVPKLQKYMYRYFFHNLKYKIYMYDYVQYCTCMQVTIPPVQRFSCFVSHLPVTSIQQPSGGKPLNFNPAAICHWDASLVSPDVF